MDKTEIIFRDATIYDFDKIIELYKKLYTMEYIIENKISPNIKEPEDYFLSRDFKKEVNARKDWIEDEKSKFIVAIYDGKIVGYTKGNVKYHQKERTFILFDDEVIVDEEYATKGIRDALIKELVTWGKKMGARRMMVFVFKGNRISRNNYKHIGLKDRHVCLSKEI